MNAKEFLGKAGRLEREISSMKEQLLQYRALAEKVTVAYGNEAVSHSRNIHSQEDVALRIIALEEEINNSTAMLNSVRIEIANLLGEIPDSRIRNVLWKKYIEYKSIVMIAKETAYSIRWTKTLHSLGLTKVDELLSQRGIA